TASPRLAHQPTHNRPPSVSSCLHIFFFQAEDGIRAFHVTGVQTCALPICVCNVSPGRKPLIAVMSFWQSWKAIILRVRSRIAQQIGRASCRESEMISAGAECGEK